MPATAPSLWTTHLDRTGPLPMSRQLAASLRRVIAEGGIGAGARLPSTRVLSAELGLARSTVVGVFEQLAAEGLLARPAGLGYFVAAPGRSRRRASRRCPLHGRSRVRPSVCATFVIPRRGEPRPFENGHAEIDGRFIADWKRLAARVLTGRSRAQWAVRRPARRPGTERAVAAYLAAARGVRCRPSRSC